MPETVYQPVNKSDNNRLSNITINDKNFELFDADVVEYNYNLVTSEDTFKIGAKTPLPKPPTSSLIKTHKIKSQIPTIATVVKIATVFLKKTKNHLTSD